MEQEIRADAVNGDEFLAEEVSVSHSSIRFVIDLKAITPRMDIASQPPRMVIRHNVVLMDPHFAKEFLSVLQDNIGKYESKFGTIKKPEALIRQEMQMRKTGKSAAEAKQDYFG